MYLKQRHLQLIGSMKVLIGSIHQPALTSSTPSILIYQGRCGGSDVLEAVRASAPVRCGRVHHGFFCCCGNLPNHLGSLSSKHIITKAILHSSFEICPAANE